MVEVARKKNKQINIRMTDEEYSAFIQRLKVSRMSQNDFVMKSILDKKITILDGFKELTDQIKKIGVNLNQLTRSVNYGQLLDGKDELKEIQKELGEVWQSLSAFLQKVR
jgi:hypothetical protein